MQGLHDNPVRLTVPVADAADLGNKCTGQPDARSQMTALYSGGSACAETLECRYWDEEIMAWSTEGCTTKLYNGTDGGAFTGCECSHLSEFVSITVPTDAFGDVEFGSIDVRRGNITHVRGEQGGMWLAACKNATHVPPTSTTAYLAYADEASAPTRWEIVDITCVQGTEPPAGAIGFPDTFAGGGSAVSHCHWLRAYNRTGSLETMLSLELTASGLAQRVEGARLGSPSLRPPPVFLCPSGAGTGGSGWRTRVLEVRPCHSKPNGRRRTVASLANGLGVQPIHSRLAEARHSIAYWYSLKPKAVTAFRHIYYRLTEDRDSRAYAAALTYALIYPAGRGTPDRREEFTVPIYTFVAVVPLVERGRPGGATARHSGLLKPTRWALGCSALSGGGPWPLGA